MNDIEQLAHQHYQSEINNYFYEQRQEWRDHPKD